MFLCCLICQICCFISVSSKLVLFPSLAKWPFVGDVLCVILCPLLTRSTCSRSAPVGCTGPSVMVGGMVGVAGSPVQSGCQALPGERRLWPLVGRAWWVSGLVQPADRARFWDRWWGQGSLDLLWPSGRWGQFLRGWLWVRGVPELVLGQW